MANDAIDKKPAISGFFLTCMIIGLGVWNPFELSPSAIWEVCALGVTIVSVGYFYVDIVLAGENSISKAITAAQFGIYILINVILVLFLFVSACIAIGPELKWSFVPKKFFGIDMLIWHAVIIFLGAVIAAYSTNYLANMEEDSTKDKTDERFLQSKIVLEKERNHADNLLWSVDVPTAIGYFIVLVIIACFNKENQYASELKTFLAGSVALGLFISNAAYVSSRLSKVHKN